MKRMLDRLRAANGGMLRKLTATRAGLQEPERSPKPCLPARARP